MNKTQIVLLLALLQATTLAADPLTPAQVKAFDVRNLSAKSFDKRMTTFRIIRKLGWQKRYRPQAIRAIKRMLRSRDVMQMRTGIQGENLLNYGTPEIHKLVVQLTRRIAYKSGPQYLYLRQAVIEYLVRTVVKARNPERTCRP